MLVGAPVARAPSPRAASSAPGRPLARSPVRLGRRAGGVAIPAPTASAQRTQARRSKATPATHSAARTWPRSRHTARGRRRGGRTTTFPPRETVPPWVPAPPPRRPPGPRDAAPAVAACSSMPDVSPSPSPPQRQRRQHHGQRHAAPCTDRSPPDSFRPVSDRSSDSFPGSSAVPVARPRDLACPQPSQIPPAARSTAPLDTTTHSAITISSHGRPACPPRPQQRMPGRGHIGRQVGQDQRARRDRDAGDRSRSRGHAAWSR